MKGFELALPGPFGTVDYPPNEVRRAGIAKQVNMQRKNPVKGLLGVPLCAKRKRPTQSQGKQMNRSVVWWAKEIF